LRVWFKVPTDLLFLKVIMDFVMHEGREFVGYPSTARLV
jgi:hypothetical protein